MIKRILAAVCALVMTAALFTACGSSDSSSKADTSSDTSQTDSSGDSSTIDVDKLVIPEKKLVINGEEVDADGLVMLTINDEYEVTFDQYRYFYHYVLDSSGIDFDDIEEEDKEDVFKELISTVDSLLSNYYSYYALAADNNIELSASDKQTVEDTYQQDVAMFDSEEDCEKYYLSMYATTEVVKDMIAQDLLFDKIDEQLFGENGTYYKTEDDFLAFAQTDEYAQVKHILVTYSSQAELSEEDAEGFDDLSLSEKLSLKDEAYEALSDEQKQTAMEKAKIEIENILKKVDSGEDFDELMAQYNWDPGMETSPEGYFITENTSFVEQFIDATFELEAGQTSGVVESSYGYHIIKREPVDLDYVKENLEGLYSDYYSEVSNAKANELLDEIINNMSYSYSDEYNNLTYDSIY